MPATDKTSYSITKLHAIFAITSVVLLIATITMFGADHSREWKGYQRTARNLDVQRIKWEQLQEQSDEHAAKIKQLGEELQQVQIVAPADDAVSRFKAQIALDAAERSVSEAALTGGIDTAYTDLTAAIKAATAEDFTAPIDARDTFLTVLRSHIAGGKFREDNLLSTGKFAKADHNVGKSDYDIGVRDHADATAMKAAQDNVNTGQGKVDDLQGERDKATIHVKKLEAILAEITAEEDAVLAKISEEHANLDQLDAALTERESTWFRKGMPPLGTRWLELPIVDAFMSPLTIDNKWTQGLTIKYGSFKPSTRFDRCTTCHQSMEKTTKGSSSNPLYPSMSSLTLVLQTPAEATDASLVSAGTEKSLASVYGLSLGASGLLNRNAVTISGVNIGSLGAKALVVEPGSETGLSVDDASDALDTLGMETESTPLGFIVGDVIVDINGTKIVGRDQALRILLESVTWGEPLVITIQRGFPGPYASHPRLDLFIGSMSPHKLAEVGCTICHEGQGSATEFGFVSHTPDTLKQRTEWSKDKGWFNNHHWPYPMNPNRFVESGCLKCHHNVTELEPSERFPDPPAPKLMAGYNNIRRYGCFGCHEVVGFESADKRIGPDLRLEPNYYAAALQVAADASRNSASDETLATIEAIARKLGAAADDNNARHDLIELLEADKAAAREAANVLSADSHSMIAVLQDQETPGQFTKVGPSLRYINAKMDQPFLIDWLNNPQHFRPETRMPRFFGLTDHLGGTEAKKAKEKYEPVEILGVATYLLGSSQKFDYLPSPDASSLTDAQRTAAIDRGKVRFQITCTACHQHGDFPDAHNDQGPNLTNIGSKLAATKGRKWLYSWIKEPARYHARTKMPENFFSVLPGDETVKNLDPVSDVVEYLLASKNDWQPTTNELDSDALNELVLKMLTKTFDSVVADGYLRDGLPEAMRADLKGAEVELLNDLSADQLSNLTEEQQAQHDLRKLRYVGRKVIGQYGCYACHDIPGFENSKPIGTTLSEWGRKDPSKLAFEHITHFVTGHGGHGDTENAEHTETEHTAPMDPYYLRELKDGSRTGFIYQKLRDPRSYDFQKMDSKAYDEHLRMPKFPLDHDQIEEIITFVLGLVAEPPAADFVYTPSPRRQAIVEGRKVLDKYNCAGCHILELEKWKLAIEPGLFESDPVTVLPYLEPHFTPEQIEASKVTDRAGLVHATITGLPRVGIDGKVMVFGYDNDDEDFYPLDEFEEDAQILPKDIGLMMDLWEPTLIDGSIFAPKAVLPVIARSQIERRYPARGGDLAKRILPIAVKMEGNNKGAEGWGYVPPPLVGEGEKVQANWLHDFLIDPHQIRPASYVRMPKFAMTSDEATKLVNYFAAIDNTNYPYEFKSNTRSDHLIAEEESYQNGNATADSNQTRLVDAMKIVTDQNFCVKCHIVGDFNPVASLQAKAPDLSVVFKRMRPDYVRRWIARPDWVLPYTSMPVNIAYDPAADFQGTLVDQKLYHGTSSEQIDGLTDLLMNYDEYTKSRSLIAPLIKQVAPDAAAAQ